MNRASAPCLATLRALAPLLLALSLPLPPLDRLYRSTALGHCTDQQYLYLRSFYHKSFGLFSALLVRTSHLINGLRHHARSALIGVHLAESHRSCQGPGLRQSRRRPQSPPEDRSSLSRAAHWPYR